MYSCSFCFKWNQNSIYVLELCAVEATLIFGSMQQHSDTIINGSTNHYFIYIILIQWNPCMLAIFDSVERHPTYTGGQLVETTWHYENLTVHNHLRKRPVQSAETGGQVGRQVHNTVNE
jgi:hypothetical protein